MPLGLPSQAALTATFAALADPSRRQILERLSRGEASVGQLAEPLEMSAPAVTKHLHVLEKAGLLNRRKEGRHHYLQLNPEPIKAVENWIAFYRAFWEGSLDNLAKYLEEEVASSNSSTQDDQEPIS